MKNDGGVKSSNSSDMLYFGIIDILTEYNSIKKMEYFGKALIYCSNKMSCVPPGKYQDRFINYMKKKFENDIDNNL